MSNTARTGNDTQPAPHALTAEDIAEKLKQAGHEVPGNSFVTIAGLSWFLGVTPRTLARWREDGTGPPAHLFGTWSYPLDGLVVWIGSRPAAGSGHARTSDDLR